MLCTEARGCQAVELIWYAKFHVAKSFRANLQQKLGLVHSGTQSCMLLGGAPQSSGLSRSWGPTCVRASPQDSTMQWHFQRQP